MLKLQDYKPDYYDGVKEMDKLLNAEQLAFDKQEADVLRLTLNTFVSQADSEGLSVFEAQLGIETDLSEDIESRRYNIQLRLLPPHPITFKYLKSLVASMGIVANIQRDVITQNLATFSRDEDLPVEKSERLKYLLNVYLPSNMTYAINTVGDVNSNALVYVGTALHLTVNTEVKEGELIE